MQLLVELHHILEQHIELVVARVCVLAQLVAVGKLLPDLEVADELLEALLSNLRGPCGRQLPVKMRRTGLLDLLTPPPLPTMARRGTRHTDSQCDFLLICGHSRSASIAKLTCALEPCDSESPWSLQCTFPSSKPLMLAPMPSRGKNDFAQKGKNIALPKGGKLARKICFQLLPSQKQKSLKIPEGQIQS